GLATPRGVVERGPVLGEQRLVGGDNTCPALERAQQEAARRLDAADDLDDDVHVVSRDERCCVGGEQARVDRKVAVTLRTSYGDTDELEPRADASREIGLVGVQQTHDLAADHTAAEQCDAEPIAHAMSSASRSSTVSRRSSNRGSPVPTATTGGLGTVL